MFTKSQVAPVVTKALRDAGQVQSTMTAVSIVALLAGYSNKQLRDMLSDGVHAIGDGMIGKLVPMANRMKGDYLADVDAMTAAAARDHIASDIELRKEVAGNFNALTCRVSEAVFTAKERRALAERDDATASIAVVAGEFRVMVKALPDNCDVAKRLTIAAKEGEDAIAIANRSSLDPAKTEQANLALFLPVNARAKSALDLIQTIKEEVTAEPEAEAETEAKTEPEAEAETAPVDPVAVMVAAIAQVATREGLERGAAIIAERLAKMAEGDVERAKADKGSAPVLAEKRQRKAA